MALKLTVISEQRGSLGACASIVLGVGGGSIGRAHDNDWVLPDPQRYLSAHHARVQFRNGGYYIEDSSTNGVYLNDASTALGRRGQHPLRHGDRLRFGDYRVDVTVDSDAEDQAEASAIFTVKPAGTTGDFSAVRSEAGSSFSVSELFSSDPGTSDSGQARAVSDTGMRAFDNRQRSGTERLLIPAAARRALRAAAQSSAAAPASGFDVFCRGAGVDAQRVPPEVHARALHLAGLLLREALGGLKGLALRQHEIRSGYQIGIAAEDVEHAALQSLPVEELLTRLFVSHDRHELDAVQWLRDTLNAARRHDAASARALPTALAEFLALLAPQQSSTDAAGRFHSITDMPDGRLPHLLAESLARAFGTEFRTRNGTENNGGGNNGSGTGIHKKFNNGG